MLSFENTQTAFSDKTNRELKKAYWLFWMVKSPCLVKLGSWFLRLANSLKIPLHWALKKTVFNHFCGGETLADCSATIENFGRYNIKTILDYAAEGVQTEKEFDQATDRIIETIKLSRSDSNIAFAVFKFTGIARFALLEKINSDKILSREEEDQLKRIRQRAYAICDTARELGLPVMIDAEESWIQNTIDEMVEHLMEKYNRDWPVVYHTLQLYRIDKLFYLKQVTKEAQDIGYIPAFKLVRGAYMEKERARALREGFNSPIHPSKEATDAAFNEGVRFCLENIHSLAVCIGTHNEFSCQEAVHFMELNQLSPNHPRVFFSQLMGMSEHISFNLADAGYNVSKYVPYGPLRLVMPYLIRRAQENTSVAGQTGRELYLIQKELKRRKKLTPKG